MQRPPGTDDHDEPDPPCNFTVAQLRHFDGREETVGKKTPRTVQREIYLSVNGIVFNASEGRKEFGPGGPFEVYAGRECGTALAKGSVEESDLADGCRVQSLTDEERSEMEGWIEKFSGLPWDYPVLGRLVRDDAIPPSDGIVSRDELALRDGSSREGVSLPEGYASLPIYICASGKVYDVSFGGVTFYGPGGPYGCFAGKDASRALAKMSLDPADTDDTSVENLTEKERKVLADWIKTYERKGYPCVGRLEEKADTR